MTLLILNLPASNHIAFSLHLLEINYELISKSLPYIPETAVAGVIAKVGAGVNSFHAGQAVCGRSPNGAYTEYATVLVDDRQYDTISLMALKPATLSFDAAATLSAGATTAWTALGQKRPRARQWPSNERSGPRFTCHGSVSAARGASRERGRGGLL